jgi:hypothetical protein
MVINATINNSNYSTIMRILFQIIRILVIVTIVIITGDDGNNQLFHIHL